MIDLTPTHKQMDKNTRNATARLIHTHTLRTEIGTKIKCRCENAEWKSADP